MLLISKCCGDPYGRIAGLPAMRPAQAKAIQLLPTQHLDDKLPSKNATPSAPSPTKPGISTLARLLLYPPHLRKYPEDTPMSKQAVKFAYWVPNVSGGLVVSKIEQRTDWGIDYNRKLAQLAEAAGFEYALTQIRFTAGYGAEFQHESVAFSHALLAATTRLKVIAAILPGPWQPALAAKQLATIDQLTNGRIAVNIVSGWFKGEFQAIGEHWLEHDERYRRSEEFIRSLRGIWSQDNFTFRGDFYRFDNYSLKPKPLGRPEIFQGGSSRAARDMAARVSDWYFTNGNSVEGIKAQVDDIRAKAAANNHSVKIGVNAFVIARDTEEEARAVLAQIIDQADPEAVNAFGDAAKQAGRASPEGEGNWAKSTFEDLVQYNDGFKTNLIGTPQQIAERIVALKAVGVDLVLAGFLHFQEEVEYFGKRVLPLVRKLEAEKTAAVA
jgi:FMNH2-dependent dimethyl sulfone monooxygenase